MHDDNRPWVSSSLFIEMLRKGSDELFSIDTIGKAGRWGIALAGAKEINILNTDAFRQACDNISAWENDTEGSASPIYEAVPSSDPDLKYFSQIQGMSLFRIQGMRHTYFCLVKPLFGPPNSRGNQRKLEGLTVKLVRDTLNVDPGAKTFYGYEFPIGSQHSHPALRSLTSLGVSVNFPGTSTDAFRTFRIENLFVTNEPQTQALSPYIPKVHNQLTL